MWCCCSWASFAKIDFLPALSVEQFQSQMTHRTKPFVCFFFFAIEVMTIAHLIDFSDGNLLIYTSQWGQTLLKMSGRKLKMRSIIYMWLGWLFLFWQGTYATNFKLYWKEQLVHLGTRSFIWYCFWGRSRSFSLLQSYKMFSKSLSL